MEAALLRERSRRMELEGIIREALAAQEAEHDSDDAMEVEEGAAEIGVREDAEPVVSQIGAEAAEPAGRNGIEPVASRVVVCRPGSSSATRVRDSAPAPGAVVVLRAQSAPREALPVAAASRSAVVVVRRADCQAPAPRAASGVVVLRPPVQATTSSALPTASEPCAQEASPQAGSALRARRPSLTPKTRASLGRVALPTWLRGEEDAVYYAALSKETEVLRVDAEASEEGGLSSAAASPRAPIAEDAVEAPAAHPPVPQPAEEEMAAVDEQPEVAEEEEEEDEECCAVCGEAEEGDVLVLCDECDAACHLHCARPRLKAVPTGEWRCGDCRAAARQGNAKQPAPNEEEAEEEKKAPASRATRSGSGASTSPKSRSGGGRATRAAKAATAQESADAVTEASPPRTRKRAARPDVSTATADTAKPSRRPATSAAAVTSAAPPSPVKVGEESFVWPCALRIYSPVGRMAGRVLPEYVC